MNILIFLAAIVYAVATVCFCCKLAEEKGRDTGTAAILAIFFGVLALIYYAGLPLEKNYLCGLIKSSVPAPAPVSSTPRRNTYEPPKPKPVSVPTTIVTLAPASFKVEEKPKAPASDTVRRIPAEDGKITCSGCGAKQKSNRHVCWNCGKAFED